MSQGWDDRTRAMGSDAVTTAVTTGAGTPGTTGVATPDTAGVAVTVAVRAAPTTSGRHGGPRSTPDGSGPAVSPPRSSRR